ncbi:Uncharacterised protein [Mycolicibacterium flavescens]|nr:Uncharacterised protein [Mycolicibacterium flavescens]
MNDTVLSPNEMTDHVIASCLRATVTAVHEGPGEWSSSTQSVKHLHSASVATPRTV